MCAGNRHRASLRHFFDDALVPGTVGVHTATAAPGRALSHHHRSEALRPEFVRGWTVERYQVDLGKAAQLNEQDMDSQVRSPVRTPGARRHLPQPARTAQNTAGRTFKHVLVPVWLVGYTYGSKNYQIIANGYTGADCGRAAVQLGEDWLCRSVRADRGGHRAGHHAKRMTACIIQKTIAGSALHTAISNSFVLKIGF